MKDETNLNHTTYEFTFMVIAAKKKYAVEKLDSIGGWVLDNKFKFHKTTRMWDGTVIFSYDEDDNDHDEAYDRSIFVESTKKAMINIGCIGVKWCAL